MRSSGSLLGGVTPPVTDAEAAKAGRIWGYSVEIGMDGYRYFPMEPVAEGTLNG